MKKLIDYTLIFLGFLALGATLSLGRLYAESRGEVTQARLAYEYCQDLLNSRYRRR